MTWTLCSSAAAIAKAGVNANSTIVASAATLAEWSDEAEGYIEINTGMSFVANISSAPGSIANAIADVVSSRIAMQIVGYDTSGYLSRGADSTLNIQNDIVQKGIKQIKDFKKTTLNNPY